MLRHVTVTASVWIARGIVWFVGLAAPQLALAQVERPLPADHAQRLTRGLTMFAEHVRPLLNQHCVRCHGGEKTRGEFDIATREGLLAGGPSGPAVVPFHADESLLIKLITHREEPAMPDESPKLSDSAIARIVDWVNHGAPYDQPLIAGKKITSGPRVITAEDKQWWAFRPLSKVSPPQVELAGGVRTEVDKFIVDKAAAKRWSLAPSASKRVLIRRAYLDLLGVPPTPSEVTEFEQDSAPDAWPRLIDRLLARPQYGERWARHWLDVARFAESAGFEHDYDRSGAWAYRDFVIKALNSDMPYDQFVRWQLAGDEFAPDDPLALSATGFLGAGVFPTQITANEVERTRYDALDDMLSTTGSALLGLTIGCARCHDHKFDPIPSHDYYRLLATFTTTVRSNIDVELDPERARKLHQQWEREHAPLAASLRQIESSLEPRFEAWLKAGGDDQPSARWTILTAAEFKAKSGAKLQRQDDGSYLASGTNAGQDEYTFTATTPLRGLTGLRLEALADASLPKQGPGRAPNGNFGLSRIRVSAAPINGGPASDIAIRKAEADFEQNKASLSVAASLDEQPNTGWAIDPQIGKNHAAVFTLAEPLDLPQGTKLIVTLEFRVNAQHSIGRPRLSVMSGATPSLKADVIPQHLATLLERIKLPGSIAQLKVDERRTLFTFWLERDAAWRAQHAKLTAHDAKQPKTTTQILICAEGYKPMRHHTQGADFFEETYFLERGSADRKKGIATQGFLQVLMNAPNAEQRWLNKPPEGAKYSGRRSALANWIVDVEHGAGALAARVIVNRLWQHHFGTGLVPSPNDFGHTGTLPTHPELLDALAGELIRGGWKLKPIHKLLMTSGVYMQSTTVDKNAPRGEEAARLLIGRQPRRLEGEAIRDCILSVSGKLDPTMYGPGTKDEKSLRRSVYFMVKRSQLIGSMVVFDQPEPLVSQGNRPTTTVAPQALLLLNGPQIREWAEAFAQRVEGDSVAKQGPRESIVRAYAWALGREPSAAESSAAERFIARQSASYQAESRPSATRLALVDFCQVLFGLNEFAYEE